MPSSDTVYDLRQVISVPYTLICPCEMSTATCLAEENPMKDVTFIE